MTQTPFNETESHIAPPLCLVHYFAEQPETPERLRQPPRQAQIAERRGNLIILEFADPPPVPPASRRSRNAVTRHWSDCLMVLLFFACLAACFAAFQP